jgi:hypothetical protein
MDDAATILIKSMVEAMELSGMLSEFTGGFPRLFASLSNVGLRVDKGLLESVVAVMDDTPKALLRTKSEETVTIGQYSIAGQGIVVKGVEYALQGGTMNIDVRGTSLWGNKAVHAGTWVDIHGFGLVFQLKNSQILMIAKDGDAMLEYILKYLIPLQVTVSNEGKVDRLVESINGRLKIYHLTSRNAVGDPVPISSLTSLLDATSVSVDQEETPVVNSQSGARYAKTRNDDSEAERNREMFSKLSFEASDVRNQTHGFTGKEDTFNDIIKTLFGSSREPGAVFLRVNYVYPILVSLALSTGADILMSTAMAPIIILVGAQLGLVTMSEVNVIVIFSQTISIMSYTGLFKKEFSNLIRVAKAMQLVAIAFIIQYNNKMPVVYYVGGLVASGCIVGAILHTHLANDGKVAPEVRRTIIMNTIMEVSLIVFGFGKESAVTYIVSEYNDGIGMFAAAFLYIMGNFGAISSRNVLYERTMSLLTYRSVCLRDGLEMGVECLNHAQITADDVALSDWNVNAYIILTICVWLTMYGYAFGEKKAKVALVRGASDFVSRWGSDGPLGDYWTHVRIMMLFLSPWAFAMFFSASIVILLGNVVVGIELAKPEKKKEENDLRTTFVGRKIVSLLGEAKVLPFNDAIALNRLAVASTNVVDLECISPDMVSYGSGIIVSEKMIMTVKHVPLPTLESNKGAKSVVVTTPDGVVKEYDVQNIMSYPTQNGSDGISIIVVDGKLPTNPNFPIMVSEGLFAEASPGTCFYVTKDHTVVPVRETAISKCGLLLTKANTEKGHSGQPLFNEKCQIIGVHGGAINGSKWNYVIPINGDAADEFNDTVGHGAQEMSLDDEWFTMNTSRGINGTTRRAGEALRSITKGQTPRLDMFTGMDVDVRSSLADYVEHSVKPERNPRYVMKRAGLMSNVAYPPPAFTAGCEDGVGAEAEEIREKHDKEHKAKLEAFGREIAEFKAKMAAPVETEQRDSVMARTVQQLTKTIETLTRQRVEDEIPEPHDTADVAVELTKNQKKKAAKKRKRAATAEADA